MPAKKQTPWYEGEHKEALFYILIAIFFVELIVGGVAFFYGIIHATPETPGGPPLARFPWLMWAAASILAPVGLLLIAHLAGTWVSRAMTREESAPGGDENVPEGMKRFYAMVRHAPTVVILLGILLIGAALFFVDGALDMLTKFFTALVPHVPWIAASLAALLAICFLAHAYMVFRQRKLEKEYAWRREVLERTGLVLVDKSSVPLPRNEAQLALIAPDDPGPKSLGEGHVLDVTASTPPEDEDKK